MTGLALPAAPASVEARAQAFGAALAPGLAYAETPDDFAAAFPVLRQLRPDLADGPDLMARVARLRAERGYQLLLRRDAEDRVVGCAGFVLQTLLVRGLHVYIDDLVTDQQVRGAGHGRTLLAACRRVAVAAGATCITLDSGTFRVEAHRFYHAAGFVIRSFHFVADLTRDD